MIIAGGIIPESDRAKMKDMGVSEVFGPGATSDDIISFIEEKM